MIGSLNQRAWDLIEEASAIADELRIQRHTLANGGQWWDFGIEAEGGLEAGRLLSEVCMSRLGHVGWTPEPIAENAWPHIQVCVLTDHPTKACLFSQYAGWRVSVGDFFGMCSGPIRAIAAREELFEKLDYKESSKVGVGILETHQPPTEAVFEEFAEKTKLKPSKIRLLVAPTSSQAGTFQIVARSVETAMHKLLELGFDVRRVRSAFGWAPLPPCGADFLTSLGRTNDAILYGGRVHLRVAGDPEDLKAIGPKVPSDSSEAYGRPFREIFEAAGGDFYQIDPHIFSPAEVVFSSLETGEVFVFGRVAPDVVKRSFGI
jgi:methenyltetrahydromethanopterin cyclohydrolase